MSRHFIIRLLLLACLWGPAAGAARADLHHATTPPDVKVETMDVYWKRPDARYIRLTFKLWNESAEDADHLFIRLYLRANNQESWRPVKVWQEMRVPGHDSLVLEYQPGAITDPVLYLGRFDMRLDVGQFDKVIDSREQRYVYQ